MLQGDAPVVRTHACTCACMCVCMCTYVAHGNPPACSHACIYDARTCIEAHHARETCPTAVSRQRCSSPCDAAAWRKATCRRGRRPRASTVAREKSPSELAARPSVLLPAPFSLLPPAKSMRSTHREPAPISRARSRRACEGALAPRRSRPISARSGPCLARGRVPHPPSPPRPLPAPVGW